MLGTLAVLRCRASELLVHSPAAFRFGMHRNLCKLDDRWLTLDRLIILPGPSVLWFVPAGAPPSVFEGGDFSSSALLFFLAFVEAGLQPGSLSRSFTVSAGEGPLQRGGMTRRRTRSLKTEGCGTQLKHDEQGRYVDSCGL